MSIPSKELFKDKYKSLEKIEGVVDNACPTIQVVAPSNLPGDYIFEVDLDGQRYAVIVPPGGVLEGQSFTAQFYNAKHHGRYGTWKDGICRCFTYGICHPHLCLACWCPLVALAQVMVRMRLNCIGSPDGVAAVVTTFRHLLGISVSYFIIDYSLEFIKLLLKSSDGDVYYRQYADDYSPPSVPDPIEVVVCEYIQSFLHFLMWAYMSIIIIRTRQAVRAKYIISQKCCCEDAACAVFCGCCTIMQMSRHTADYEKYDAPCCTETGIPSNIDATV